jgi:predicted DsbA family dithiol-disulfide isomerase
MNITIYFDYLCPYCYRGTKFFAEMAETMPEVHITWRYFSLEQNNAKSSGKPDDWYIWEQSLDYEAVSGKPHLRGLTAFMGSHAASLQGEDAFHNFREVLFRLRHDEQQDSSDPAVIMEAARQANLDMITFEANWLSQAGRDRLRDDHLSGVKLGVFGGPTIIVNDCEPTYLKLSEYPPAAERKALFEELIQAMTARPYLKEFKRATA